MIALHATLQAKPGRRDALVDALDAIRVESAREPGTFVFTVHTVRDDDRTVFCYEVYRDEAAQTAHREGTALQAMMSAFADLVEGPPSVVYLSLVGATGLDLS